MEKINLPLPNDKHVFYRESDLRAYKDKLSSFIELDSYMKDFSFASKMLMSQGIKFNNSIEGISNNIEMIDSTIASDAQVISSEQQKILNLYNGYDFILSNNEINKESLRHLYQILCKGQLDNYSLSNMGDYYRNKDVFIYQRSRIDEYPAKGADPSEIDMYMNILFEYINNGEKFSDDVDEFIKSQIIHFFFIYIHPYFDVNGRTGRTLAMWYLFNEQKYPYIVFNRAIAFAKKEYESSIREGRKYGDITEFLIYILKYVEAELEKEYLIQIINLSSGEKLENRDIQTLQYILYMNGNLTLKDYASTYNYFNNHKKIKDIYIEQILPLLDKGIIKFDRFCNSKVSDDMQNFSFSINDMYAEVDPTIFKSLKLEKFIKK